MADHGLLGGSIQFLHQLVIIDIDMYLESSPGSNKGHIRELLRPDLIASFSPDGSNEPPVRGERSLLQLSSIQQS